MTASERLLERLLARSVTKGSLTLICSDGTSRSFGAPTPGFPDVTIRLGDKRVARDILTDVRLGFGEAYMEGRIPIERGDVMQLVSLMRANNRWEDGRDLVKPDFARRIGNRFISFASSFNRPGRSKKNVAHHYDIGNELYELMLDPEHMQYSCGYWSRDEMTLAEAQEAKLAHIASKLDLKHGNRVLDIGCGWGGMAIFLAKRTGAEVLGITLSENSLPSPVTGPTERGSPTKCGLSWPTIATSPDVARASTGSSPSACSSMSERRNLTPFFALARTC